MLTSTTTTTSATHRPGLAALRYSFFWLLIALLFLYLLYSSKLLLNQTECRHLSITETLQNATDPSLTSTSILRFDTHLNHIVFGIAASSSLWRWRKEYIKLWWRPGETRGVVWLDNQVRTKRNESLPEIRISRDTSRFRYTNRQGTRSAIRISRVVSETMKLGLKDVRWLVMGDDDTVFILENLVRVLSKYNHEEYYYIGSSSESHVQNIFFSYTMAYGGAGFAISYPLAVELEKMQDRCIQRYPSLYGSDDRIQACMAELNVPLTKEIGFHQVGAGSSSARYKKGQRPYRPLMRYPALDRSSGRFRGESMGWPLGRLMGTGISRCPYGSGYPETCFDVYGNLLGLLGSHPVAPLVSVHHLDIVDPLFPGMTRTESIRHLLDAAKYDSASIAQQSICYDKTREWSILVSWGFAIQVVRGMVSPRELDFPSRTFLNWYKKLDYTAYSFNTRPVSRNKCQKPFVFYMSRMIHDKARKKIIGIYTLHRERHPYCNWKMESPGKIDNIVVLKSPDNHRWQKAPRKDCCRMLPATKKGTMYLWVDGCQKGEVVEWKSSKSVS
ncbi:hypothetical protein OSB04_023425 [Centaurea solstitialis]|uniref:Uncharacterized protein n=1 Tax=Centaurea solstitialis TaxID=347529 RepID=A0AA38SJU6_9ASTR|nr:hypothetical protein OSB04_023425 [Centaurea solstitialis]